MDGTRAGRPLDSNKLTESLQCGGRQVCATSCLSRRGRRHLDSAS
jgi:hypothetical protein